MRRSPTSSPTTRIPYTSEATLWTFRLRSRWQCRVPHCAGRDVGRADKKHDHGRDLGPFKTSGVRRRRVASGFVALFSSPVSRSAAQQPAPTPTAREAGWTSGCARCGRKPIVWPARPSRSSATSASWKSSATSASPKPKEAERALARREGGSQRDEPAARAARGTAAARPARPEDAARGNLQARTQRLSPAAALGRRPARVRPSDPGDDRADLPAGARAQRFPDHARRTAEGAAGAPGQDGGAGHPGRRRAARACGGRTRRRRARGAHRAHRFAARPHGPVPRRAAGGARPAGSAARPGWPTSGAGRWPCRWRPSAAGSNGR